MNTKKKNAGVTLIELILVIFILGLIFTIAVLSYRDNGKKAVETGLVMLQDDLRYIRKLAIAENTYAQIDFFKDYYILKKTTFDGENIITVRRVELKGAYIISMTAATATARTVKYTPRGTTGNACTVDIASTSGSYRGSLTVNVGSGRVEIKEIVKIK